MSPDYRLGLLPLEGEFEFDAASFTEVARAQVPHHVPFGFHGQYFGGNEA